MLHVYDSNRMERLAARLAAIAAQPQADPLASETVIVQSNGLGRWLSFSLAQQLGICANVTYQFPAAFIWNLASKLVADEGAGTQWTAEAMTWRVTELLANLGEAERFAELNTFLAGGDLLARYELALRIADTYEQYSVFRPEWLLAWQRGEETHWQATLWRRLMGDHTWHRAALMDRFRTLLQSDPQAAEKLAGAGLPARISLIGIPAMPPVYLEVFQLLSRYIDVHWFLFNPCEAFWADIKSPREIARIESRISGGDAHAVTGNSLLASLGQQGRDFFALLMEHIDEPEEHYFEAPGDDCLLHALQQDILVLEERRHAPLAPSLAEDRSVQFHSCHSPMREVEVLYDQLLYLFESQPQLSPGDVVVMTPDIETYAPFIEAVFATAAEGRRIPYCISDRSLGTENQLGAAFLKLLELLQGRFAADEVLTLLQAEAVRSRFDLAEDDLALVQDWLRETNIRWGVDADSRAALGLPAASQHTWRNGLDQLMLGFAMEGRALFDEVLPHRGVEAEEAQVMGRLHHFLETLMDTRRVLAMGQPMAAWAQALNDLLARFFKPADEMEMQGVRDAIREITVAAHQAEFSADITLPVIQSCLQARLDAPPANGAFLNGGVTFCAMMPMRSIPFPVVCLIGMNDGAFPRIKQPYGFDLMAKKPRLGDRSRRDDDRYLFLEALLSARTQFYISYVGQSIHDNSHLPPAVVVSELLDYIRNAFMPPDTSFEQAAAQLLVQHPLQPFSSRYFLADATASRLFSYSEAYCAASRAAGQARRVAQPWIQRLPEPEPGWRHVTLEQLTKFLAHPAKYLLQGRLGVSLREAPEPVAVREPFALDGLANYGVNQQLLETCLAGRPAAETYPLLRASGILPHGSVGEALFQRNSTKAETFAQEVLRMLPVETEMLAIDLRLGEMRLTGQLAGVGEAGLFHYRFGKTRARHWLDLWVQHLAMNAASQTATSHWLAEDGAWTLQPLPQEQACRLLDELLQLYWQGLSAPLPFFAESAFAYVMAEQNQKDGRREAQKAWQRDAQQGGPRDRQLKGEGEDPWNSFFFADTDPLDEAFERLARQVFTPLLAAREEVA
jgi:exodeoxyribonuclease V gamma subunit